MLSAICASVALLVTSPVLAQGEFLVSLDYQTDPSITQNARAFRNSRRRSCVSSATILFEKARRAESRFVSFVEAFLFQPSVTVQVGSAAGAYLDGAALFVHGGLLARS
jgi:hypothetical protein